MAKEEPKPGPRYPPLLQLLRTSETIWNASRLFFQQWDLSPSQFNILNLLRGSTEGLTQVELSRELITHRSNVTGLVDRLEKRALVTRKISPSDRRVWRVSLTDEGLNLISSILPDYFRLIEQVWAGVSAGQARMLSKHLKVLATAAEGITAKFEVHRKEMS
jgi:DNA-binding MarR family transcriptional regulator